MLTAQTTMTSKRDITGVTSSEGGQPQDLELLSERLLRQQPQSKALLERLLARSRRTSRKFVFASVTGKQVFSVQHDGSQRANSEGQGG